MHAGPVVDTVIAVIAQTLKRDTPIQPDSELIRIGADSMAMIRIVARCEEIFDIEFDADDLVSEKLATPQLIAALLVGKYAVGETSVL